MLQHFDGQTNKQMDWETFVLLKLLSQLKTTGYFSRFCLIILQQFWRTTVTIIHIYMLEPTIFLCFVGVEKVMLDITGRLKLLKFFSPLQNMTTNTKSYSSDCKSVFRSHSNRYYKSPISLPSLSISQQRK